MGSSSRRRLLSRDYKCRTKAWSLLKTTDAVQCCIVFYFSKSTNIYERKNQVTEKRPIYKSVTTVDKLERASFIFLVWLKMTKCVISPHHFCTKMMGTNYTFCHFKPHKKYEGSAF